jgi:hypothetical protein
MLLHITFSWTTDSQGSLTVVSMPTAVDTCPIVTLPSNQHLHEIPVNWRLQSFWILMSRHNVLFRAHVYTQIKETLFGKCHLESGLPGLTGSHGNITQLWFYKNIVLVSVISVTLWSTPWSPLTFPFLVQGTQPIYIMKHFSGQWPSRDDFS